MRTTWKDGKRQQLEELLGEFVAYLSTVALAFKLKREDDERRRCEALEAQMRRHEEELRRYEEERRRRAEEERGKQLEAEVTRWRTACDIRAYVKEAERLLEGAEASEEQEQRRGELAWALEWAKRIDPLGGSGDERQ